MKKRTLIIILFFLSGICLNAFAEDIKARMMNRLPEIKVLKAKGIVGENNRGYLEFRGGREKENIVNAENSDRKAAYESIAKQQNTSLDVVEKHRAAQIEQNAAPGDLLQDATGKWYKK